MLKEKDNNVKNAVNDTEIALTDAERQPCEIWTRVMGYHRSVSSFNKGKKSEFAERVCFDNISGCGTCRTQQNDDNTKCA